MHSCIILFYTGYSFNWLWRPKLIRGVCTAFFLHTSWATPRFYFYLKLFSITNVVDLHLKHSHRLISVPLNYLSELFIILNTLITLSTQVGSQSHDKHMTQKTAYCLDKSCDPWYTVWWETFEGENICKFWGFVAIRKSFLCEIGGRGVFWERHKWAIYESPLRKHLIFSQFVKVFSLESFPLYGTQK